MNSGFSKIVITEPCSENWDQMTAQQKGRHCDKCAKVVVDFTKMSDSQMMAYMKQHPNSCGRFYNHQLNHEIPVFKTEPLALKFFRKLAITGIFAAHFWPRKVESQEIKIDTLTNTTAFKEQVINIIYPNQKTISGKVIQPDSSNQKAIKLRFSIDTFCLSVDLTISNDFSFQLPQEFIKDSMDVELFTYDTVYNFKDINILEVGSSFLLNGTRGQIYFQFNDSWTYHKVFNYQFIPPTTMGIWVDYRKNFDIPTNIKLDSNLTKLIYTTLGLASPTGLYDDSLHNAGLKKAKYLYHLKRKENKISVWWWLLLPITLLLILVKWACKKDETILINESSG